MNAHKAMDESTLTFDIEADELNLFLQDVNDLLGEMENGILRLEQTTDSDTLNSVFRAAHTLKAVAATVGHQAMAELTHTMETLFEAMREETLTPTQAVVDELLHDVDVLRLLRDEVVNSQASGIDVSVLLARLQAVTKSAVKEASNGDGGEALDYAPPALTPEQVANLIAYETAGLTILTVQTAVTSSAFAPSARLMQATMALQEVGEIVVQRPTPDDLINDNQDGTLWLLLATDATVDAVTTALAMCSDLVEGVVQPYLAEEAPAVVETILNNPQDETAAAAPAFNGVGGGAASVGGKTVRINVERLDALMNLVGELVTDRNRLLQIEETMRGKYGRNGAIGGLTEMTTHFGRVVDQLQEEVMRARMMPIFHLFHKFPRLVRDVSRAAGKSVNLVIAGETTELDRSVIEAIGDPLTHLLRNAIDHGIESPAAREAAGEPAAGTIHLTAEHIEGQIVITIVDDGQGIDPERVRQAAVNRDMMTAEEVAQLSDDEAINLIFRPNLSTNAEVTEVSGRGVGMDVVRTNIEQMGGMVVVESEIGRGTTFRLMLPLTLAILQSMLVGLGDEVFAVPLTGILDTMYLADVTVHSVKGRPIIRWRDSVLPLLNLRTYFNDARLGLADTANGRQAVVTVAWGKINLGLGVDRIIGQQEIVVKPLSPVIGSVAGLSGCAILGDGRVALILDIPSLVNDASQTNTGINNNRNILG